MWTKKNGSKTQYSSRFKVIKNTKKIVSDEIKYGVLELLINYTLKM